MNVNPISDEATGLPPLGQPVEEDTLWVMALVNGQADVLSPLDGSPRGAFVLSVRGLINTLEGDAAEWAQLHLAFPHGSVSILWEVVDDYLAKYPEES